MLSERRLPFLLIRSDASTQIGTGHLMRCITLAHAWKDIGGQVVFISACSNERFLQRLYDEDFVVYRLERSYPDLQDWQVTERILSENPDAWLVLDGYHFDFKYQRKVKEADYRLMVIDDMAHLPCYYGDIVLNQNIHAGVLRYSCKPYTRLLLGTKYVLLQHEFLKWRGWKREIPEVARKILVTLGGSDPNNMTLKVIRALKQVKVDGLEVVVVVGGRNPHNKELQSAVNSARLPIRLENNVRDMADLMAWADIAVSAGGSTCWELAFMQLPSIILVLADNQRPVAESLDKAGMAVNLGTYENLPSGEISKGITALLVAAGERREMARHGQELVDGDGVNRVLMCMRGQIVRLRHVRESDCTLLWEWASDPEVRAASFSPNAIPWEQHVQWFNSKLTDCSCIYYIAVDREDVPVGQVRYDIDGNEAVVSISVGRKFRGKGYGSPMILLSSRKLFDVSDVSVIHAYVKGGNGASIQAFIKGEFKAIGTEEIYGYKATHLVLRKSELR